MMTKHPKLNQQASVWAANTYMHVHIVVHSNWKRRSGSNFGGQTGRCTRFGSQRWVGSTRREVVGGDVPVPQKKNDFFRLKWRVLVNFERYFLNVGRQLALASPSLNSGGLVPPFPLWFTPVSNCTWHTQHSTELLWWLSLLSSR